VTEGCPALLVDEFEEVFRAWEWLQQGVLPMAGGWSDQSPLWIEMMEIVRRAKG